MSKLSKLGKILNGKTIPDNNGSFPAYGGNGVMGMVDKYNYPENTIVIGRVGANCGAVHFSESKCWVTDNALAFIAKDNDPYFVYCLLRMLNLNRFHIGSSQPLITQGIINNIEYAYVETEAEQKRIAYTIKSIEDKISNNTAICSDLEAMAKLLYDYWFVQFDFPDENGKPYKSSGGKMVWNEQLKRVIPEGWIVHSLQDYISSSKNGDWGYEMPIKEDDIEVRCFRGADFASITSNYQTTAPVRYISKNNSDRLLSDGDLVVEISGGSPVQSTGRVGYINQKFLDRCGGVMDCSNFCKAFTPKKRIYQYWLYQTWKMYYDAGVMFNFESKTTGIKNLMFDSVIRDIKIPFPPDELLSEYQNRVSLFYDKTQDVFMESAELAELRDFLLPMLMNGQVRVGKNR